MGTIPTHTIEQIAAANDIVEVIGSYFPLKRAGSNFHALCPFHQEKTPVVSRQPGSGRRFTASAAAWAEAFSAS